MSKFFVHQFRRHDQAGVLPARQRVASEPVSKLLSRRFSSVYELDIFEKVRYQGWYGEVCGDD